ncbi:glycosyltransferase [Tamlana crocina]
MIIVSAFITIAYLLLIGAFIFGLERIALFNLENLASKTNFSIVIPFRNEAENLPGLLASIERLNYPKDQFETLFIDDASEDNSAEIIKQSLSKSNINFKIVKNERSTASPKKDAIETAIKQAKHDWIITTDADCILPEYWLNSFDEFIQKNDALCISGPVTYTEKNSFLNRFQILDLLSLQGATIGGFGLKKPFLCNGANLAYKKELFLKLNGFEGNSNIASGDDIFLLEKVAKTHPKQLHYLKCKQAIVETLPQPSWNHLFEQRKRWAAKTSNYNNGFGKLTGLVVLLMNALVVFGLGFSIFGALNPKFWIYIFAAKFCIDFGLIYKSAIFFNQKSALKSFVFAFLVYPFFSVFVALTSLVSGYQWKGRTFKK